MTNQNEPNDQKEMESEIENAFKELKAQQRSQEVDPYSEIKDANKPDVEEETEQSEQEEDPILQKAISMGYDPDRYKPDDPNYTGPAAWVKYGSLQKNNAETKQRIDKMEAETKAELDAIKKLEQNRAELEIAKYKQQLEEARKSYDAGGIDSAYQNLQNAELRKQQLNVQPVQAQPQVIPEIQQWREANPWIDDTNDPRSFKAHKIAKDFASIYGDEMITKNPTALIKAVENELGLGKPTANPRATAHRAGADVSTAPKGVNTPTKPSPSMLTPEQSQLWKSFTRQGLYSEKDFGEFYKAIQAEQRYA